MSNANLAFPTEDNDSLWDPTRVKFVLRIALGPPGLAMAVEKEVTTQAITQHASRMLQGLKMFYWYCLALQEEHSLQCEPQQHIQAGA